MGPVSDLRSCRVAARDKGQQLLPSPGTTGHGTGQLPVPQLPPEGQHGQIAAPQPRALKSPLCERSSPNPGPALRGSRGIGAELPPHRHGQPAAGTGAWGGPGMSVKASGARQQNAVGQQHPPGRPRCRLGRRRCAAPRRQGKARPGGPGDPGTGAPQPPRSEGPGALLRPRTRPQDGSAPPSSGTNLAPDRPVPADSRQPPPLPGLAGSTPPEQATSGPAATSDPGSKTPSCAGAGHGGPRGRGEWSGAGRRSGTGSGSAGLSGSIPLCARRCLTVPALSRPSAPRCPPSTGTPLCTAVYWGAARALLHAGGTGRAAALGPQPHRRPPRCGSGVGPRSRQPGREPCGGTREAQAPSGAGGCERSCGDAGQAVGVPAGPRSG